MFHEPETIEEYQALLEKLREEAGPRNDGVTNLRSDSLSLRNIRQLLNLPRWGLPIQRWETDAEGNVYLD